MVVLRIQEAVQGSVHRLPSAEVGTHQVAGTESLEVGNHLVVGKASPVAYLAAHQRQGLLSWVASAGRGKVAYHALRVLKQIRDDLMRKWNRQAYEVSCLGGASADHRAYQMGVGGWNLFVL